MKKVHVFLALAAVFALLSFVNIKDWVWYTSVDFKAEFPELPTPQSQSVNSAIGVLKLNVFMVDVSKNEKDENLTYGVITTEYPDTIIHSDKKELLPVFFRGSVDGAVKNVQGKLLTEKDITLDGFPGKEIDIDYRNGLAVIKMRSYLVKNKMFILQTITKTEKFPNKSLERFMSSFSLKK